MKLGLLCAVMSGLVLVVAICIAATRASEANSHSDTFMAKLKISGRRIPVSAELSEQDMAAVEEAKKEVKPKKTTKKTKKTAANKAAVKAGPSKKDVDVILDSASESDVDEVDEVYALQAIDRLAEHGNQDALRRIKERANQKMKEMLLKKYQPTIDKYKPAAQKIMKGAAKAKKVIDKIKGFGL